MARYTLYGYLERREDGRWVAYCLRPYLVVEGATSEDASAKMQELIDAYLADAAKDGRVAQVMRRRAPLGTYVSYGITQLVNRLPRRRGGRTAKTYCIEQYA